MVRRAIGKSGAQTAMRTELHRLTAEAEGVPAVFRKRLRELGDRAIDYAESVAARPEFEKYARLVTSGLYNALSAVLLAWEGDRIGRTGGDARRLLMARFVVEHRLDPAGPLDLPRNEAWEEEAAELLLSDDPVPLVRAAELVGRN